MTQDNMNFTTGSIFRKLIGFMMPILGALLLQTMYGAVDILVVGGFHWKQFYQYDRLYFKWTGHGCDGADGTLHWGKE